MNPRSSRSVPSVVEIEIHVSGIDEPQRDHPVGYILDQVFVDVGLEFVPRAPAHLRRVGQTFPFGTGGIRLALLSGSRTGKQHGCCDESQKDVRFHYLWFIITVSDR